MSYIIKNNQPLVNLKLTDIGRRNLSSGELNFSLFGLGDGEMDYSNSDPSKVNVLRPTDNNHEIMFPVPYNGTTYKVPITLLSSFPQIAHNPAKTRGFFTGATSYTGSTTIDPKLATLYNLTGIPLPNTSTIGLKYVKTTGSTINVGVGTGYTTSLIATGYTKTVRAGDYLLIKLIQNAYYTGHTTTTLTPTVNINDPVQYLWYQIQTINGGMSLNVSGITNNQTITFTLDRPLPNFQRKMLAKGFVYPGGDSIANYYDRATPIAYWSNGALSFTPVPGQETMKDVPVWNMNIVNVKDIIGLNPTIFKSKELNAGKNYLGTAINYGYLGFSGYTSSTEKIGIIHYTNNTIHNYYGEGFYSTTLALTIPYLMWHKRQFGGVAQANKIGYTFKCDPTIKFINDTVPYYDLIDQESEPTVVGKVLVDEKIIIIEHPELLAALSFKANRNWTLPAPDISLVDVGHCAGNSVTGGLQPNETLHLTYLLGNSKGITGLHCEDYQSISNISSQPKDVLFQFKKKPLDPTYSEFSYTRDFANEKGVGFSADSVHLLWQKTERGGLPDSTEWHSYDMSRFLGTTGCIDQQTQFLPNDFYLNTDSFANSLVPASDNLTKNVFTLAKVEIGDVIVSAITGVTFGGKVLKQSTSLANVGINGDYFKILGTGLTNSQVVLSNKFSQITSTLQVSYLVGSTTAAAVVQQQVGVPSTGVPIGNTYLDGIYRAGVIYNLTLNKQPNNNTVYLFYNGLLLNSTNYGVFTTGTTANRRVQLNFTPTNSSQFVMFYLDNSASGATLSNANFTANNLNNLKIYVNDDILSKSATNIYDVSGTVPIPNLSSVSGFTFGDEVFFYGNVATDIKATIYKSLFTCNILPNTFIKSNNPTFNINQDKVAFTEIGIYDSNEDLVAIGKFSQPLTRKYNSDILALQATIDF